MIISPACALTTSSGIFSPNRMLLSASVNSSVNSRLRSSASLARSFTCFLRSRGSRRTSLSAETFTSITIPCVPLGTVSDVSRTSAAFSPKIARNNRSSGASSVSLLGVILPTRMSPGDTSAPGRITPSRLRFRRASSPTFGISRVISSGPNLVSRAPTSNSVIWIEVKASSRTTRSLMTIASSKLYPAQGINATCRLRPSANSPFSVAGPSASTSPFFTVSPTATMGFWLKQVPALVRRNLRRRYDWNVEGSAFLSGISPSAVMTIRSADT